MTNKMEKLIFVLFGVCLGMAILGIVFSWTPPGQAPPGGNVAQPINVSTSTQYKAGALGIGGVFQAYGGSANPVLNVVGGNVGIGTTAPGAKLHVQQGDILLKADADDPGDIVFQNSAGTQKARIWSDPSAGVNKLHLSSADNTPDITIDATGNVGIGTTAPAHKLDVNGNINIGDRFCYHGQCYYLVDANLGEDIYPMWNTDGGNFVYHPPHSDNCDGDNYRIYTCKPYEERTCLDSAETGNGAHHRRIVCKRAKVWSTTNLPIDLGCWAQYPNLILYNDASWSYTGKIHFLSKQVDVRTGCW